MNSWIIEVGSGIFLSSLDQPFLEGEVNLHKPYLKAIISATEKLKFFVIILIEVLFDSNYSDNSTPPVGSSHTEREKGILHFYRVEEDVRGTPTASIDGIHKPEKARTGSKF
ncbi:hypothetical protein OIU77_016961 [Salix suchowensis]|uniref:Uncharacterized protein n=1 Tax=Salix suchowensis TaxID=1278906 RepID=A0ABQ8ZMJ5_9ROSI|nr:hypothetical protein OIU77_016961 [Salix suchowensis]